MNDINESRRMAINFDLNIAQLRKHYSRLNPKGAYRELGRFFHQNGFEHRQGSGYVSVEPISTFQLIKMAEKLYTTFPWLEKCSTRLDATEVGEIYDLKHLMQNERGNWRQVQKKRVNLKNFAERTSIHETLQELKQQLQEQQAPEQTRDER